jgi:hypothetical protein
MASLQVQTGFNQMLMTASTPSPISPQEGPPPSASSSLPNGVLKHANLLGIEHKDIVKHAEAHLKTFIALSDIRLLNSRDQSYLELNQDIQLLVRSLRRLLDFLTDRAPVKREKRQELIKMIHNSIKGLEMRWSTMVKIVAKEGIQNASQCEALWDVVAWIDSISNPFSTQDLSAQWNLKGI